MALIHYCEALHQLLQYRRQKQKDKVDHSVAGDAGSQPILIANVAIDESQQPHAEHDCQQDKGEASEDRQEEHRPSQAVEHGPIEEASLALQDASKIQFLNGG